MQTIVRLDRLPPDFDWPPCCRGKIRYDPDRRQLIFHGHMALYEYQALIGASDDVDYTLAIDWLFRNCDRQRSPEPGPLTVVRRPGWVFALASVAFALVSIAITICATMFWN